MKAAVIWMSVTVASLPAAAFAQQDLVAPREGNIWGGVKHEPSAPAVQNAEGAAGVALPPAQAQQEDRELEEIQRQLTGQAPTGQPPTGQAPNGQAPQ